MPVPVLILLVVLVNEIGKFNRLSIALKEKLFGCLRLSFMAYGICSLGLGWATALRGCKAPQRGYCSCFSDSGHYAGLFQSLKCFYAASLSSDDHHDDTIETSRRPCNTVDYEDNWTGFEQWRSGILAFLKWVNLLEVREWTRRGTETPNRQIDNSQTIYKDKLLTPNLQQ